MPTGRQIKRKKDEQEDLRASFILQVTWVRKGDLEDPSSSNVSKVSYGSKSLKRKGQRLIRQSTNTKKHRQKPSSSRSSNSRRSSENMSEDRKRQKELKKLSKLKQVDWDFSLGRGTHLDRYSARKCSKNDWAYSYEKLGGRYSMDDENEDITRSRSQDSNYRTERGFSKKEELKEITGELKGQGGFMTEFDKQRECSIKKQVKGLQNPEHVAAALKELIANGDPLASLPDATMFPELRSWLLQRAARRPMSQDQHKALFRLSQILIGRLHLKRPYHVPLPYVQIPPKGLSELTWDYMKEFRKRLAFANQRYRDTMRRRQVSGARELWMCMLADRFPNTSAKFRRTFWTYMPADVSDAWPVAHWIPSPFNTLSKAKPLCSKMIIPPEE